MAAEVISFLPVIAMGTLGSLALFFKNKRKYKSLKKAIYFTIKKGINDNDFDLLADGVEQLKNFDKKFMNLSDGTPVKKIFEKIFRIKRTFKMDKFEELFNIPKEVAEDATKLKRFVSNTVGNISQSLSVIMEEEKKETQVVKELKVKLEKVKRKQLAQNNAERQIIDNLNFTDKIQELHQEYEQLFIKTFEQEKDLQNILQRGMKKQMILKKMKQIQDKNTASSNKASC